MAVKTPLKLALGSSGGLSLAEMTREEDQRRRAEAAERPEDAPRTMRDYGKLIPERGVQLNLDRFPYQEAWFSEDVARAHEVIWMKAAQVGMCLSGDTRVLTADLRWVRLGDVRPGDELVAVDENASGHGIRKMRKAVVNARWDTRREAVRLHFDDGSSVDCSREHRWLVRCAGGQAANRMAWLAAEGLREGDRIRAVASRTWEGPDAEDGWMAGLLDGEGCLNRRVPHEGRSTAPARLAITQNLGILDRARRYLDERGYTYADTLKARRLGVDDGRTLTLGRADEVMRLLGTTRPARWREAWWEGARMFSPRDERLREVVEIESLGERDLVDIQTSTGTFIAEGLVSHNSGYAWRWAVQRCDLYIERVIYFFPTDDDVADFGDQRIEPSIGDSPYLRSRIPASNVKHKHLKQIGGGFLSLRGTQSPSAVQSVDADALVFDEVEYLHQPNLEQALRRVAGAEAAGRQPRKRWLGYPRLPGGPLHVRYERSDKRVWHVTCPACGLEQPLDWKNNVRWRTYEDGPIQRWGKDQYESADEVFEAWRQCAECEASLEETTEAEGEENWGPIRRGRWIATRPGAKVIGFHVTRLIVPFTNIAELVENSRKTTPGAQEAFWNNDLGLPFSPAEASLDEDTIRAAMTFGVPMVNLYRARSPIVAGLDVASERDLSIAIQELARSGPDLGLYVGEPSNFDEVIELITNFRIETLVVDSQPERRMARRLAELFPGRVHLAVYAGTDDADPWKFDQKKNMVTLNRTEAIDAMMDRIRHQTYAPPQNAPPKYVNQLMAPKRQTVEKPSGKKVRVYESTGPDGDDLAHAEVYNLAAKYMRMLRLQVSGESEKQRGKIISDRQLGLGRRRSIDSYNPGLGGR